MPYPARYSAAFGTSSGECRLLKYVAFARHISADSFHPSVAICSLIVLPLYTKSRYCLPDAASDSAPYAPSVFDDVTPTIKYISSSSPALFAIYAARPVSFTMPGEGTSGTSPYILEKLSFPGAHSSPFGSSSFWLNKRRAAAAAVPLSPEEAAGTVPPPFSLASVTHPESAIRHASIRLIKHNAFLIFISLKNNY